MTLYCPLIRDYGKTMMETKESLEQQIADLDKADAKNTAPDTKSRRALRQSGYLIQSQEEWLTVLYWHRFKDRDSIRKRLEKLKEFSNG